MANEITLTASLTVAKGNYQSLTRSVSNFRKTKTGTSQTLQVISVSDSAEQLLTIDEDISKGGYAFFRHVEGTGYIDIGVSGASLSDDFRAFIRLDPGDAAVLPLGTLDVYALASGSGNSLEYWINDD